MKVGVTLPQFRDDAGPALDAAGRAEAVGLDGVFVFDHLWPIGRPDRPALAGLPLAAALAAETGSVAVGTLVARVGLLPDAVLAHTLVGLHRIAGPRLIAGLGVGDHLSRAENAAYGVAFASRDERLVRLAGMCRRLRARGITTWVGGNSPSAASMAQEEADGLNLWGVGVDAVARAAAGLRAPVAATWAGQVDLAAGGTADGTGGTGVATGAGLGELLGRMAAAGAAWAVVAPLGVPWPEAVELVAAAAGALVD